MKSAIHTRVYRGLVGGLLATSFLVGPAFAEQVSLVSKNGEVSVSGDLTDFADNHYILNVPALGTVRIDAAQMTCSGPGCPVPSFEAGGQITLTTSNGTDSLSGELIDYTDGVYTVQIGPAQMTANAADVTCTGPGCPALVLPASNVTTEAAPTEEVVPVRLDPDLVMVGSDNVGEDLMPLVLETFAERLNASVSEAVEFPDDIAQFTFTPRGGGDPFVLEIESTDSDLGIDRLIEGTADIAMSSRQAEPRQIAALAAQGRGNLLDVSQEYVVGVDAIVMIINPSNPVEVLSRRQLAAIYTGQITNWSQVGGPNLPIVVVARPGGSARRTFEGWALEGNEQLRQDAVIIDGGKKLTREVLATPGGIGYSISDNVLESKPVDLILDCGVRTDASPFKSKAEEYLMGRRIRLYIDNQNPKREVRQMVDLMISPEADDEVDESGYYSLGLDSDPNGLSRLMDAAMIGQPQAVGLAARADISNQLRGADRLSLTIRFDTDDFSLDSKARRDLDRLVEYLARPENAGREFIFVGFADTVGQYAYNVQLSRDRAAQVLNRVRSHPEAAALRGVNMSVAGFGEAAPVGCNDDTYGRSRNRRVEVWVR